MNDEQLRQAEIWFRRQGLPTLTRARRRRVFLRSLPAGVFCVAWPWALIVAGFIEYGIDAVPGPARPDGR